MVHTPITRRTFIAHAAALATSVPAAARAQSSSRATLKLRIGVVGWPGAHTDPRGMGLTLGVEEATRAASLFGGTIALLALERMDRPASMSAIVGDGDCARCASLGASAEASGIPFLNVGCALDELRGASCRRTMFHLAPSEAMVRDALSMAHGVRTPVAWHPSLTRFGADTLNRRFRERFGQAMTSDAWTAWLSAKILWESALRMQSADPASLMRYLTRDSTQFDGHKGVPLSFRSWDRQLRQPLYAVDGANTVELPVATSPSESSRDMLDRLGKREQDSSCRRK